MGAASTGRRNLNPVSYTHLFPSPIFLPVQRRFEGMGQRFDGGGEQRAVGGGHGKAGIGSHFADEGRGGPEERFELGLSLIHI